EHVKFIFATTEVRKVPVTVLSRCQRFDLRRVDVELLRSHFKGIAEREGIAVEDQAVTLIARAAEGSVRDGLSILDQVMAHATGSVAAADVRAMLGVAERTRVFDLLETVLKGDAGAALGALAALYEDGAEPAQILADMAEAVHVVTRIKAAGADAADPTLSEAEQARATDLAGRLGMSVLARAWQMLLKGLAEVPAAPRPLVAAEMVVVRLAYAAELPPPEDLIRRAGRAPAETDAGASQPSGGEHDGAASMGAPAPPMRAVAAAAEPVGIPDIEAAPAPVMEPEATLESFEDVVALAERHRELQLCRALEEQVRLVQFRSGHIELRLLAEAPKTLANELGDKLKQWTGTRWIVAVSEEEGEKTVGEVKRERKQQEREAVAEHPAVQAVFDQFPEAEIVDVRPVEHEPDDGA
ncbi:MAG: DNA polymerase III subunit gamma/tau, partial [Methyloligellaceae bacterium]